MLLYYYKSSIKNTVNGIMNNGGKIGTNYINQHIINLIYGDKYKYIIQNTKKDLVPIPVLWKLFPNCLKINKIEFKNSYRCIKNKPMYLCIKESELFKSYYIYTSFIKMYFKIPGKPPKIKNGI